MAVELLAADSPAEKESEGGRLSSDPTVKDNVGPDTASASEMLYERKRKYPALRTGRGFGSHGLVSRSHELRPGQYQLLGTEEPADAHKPVRLSPYGLTDAIVPSYQSEVCNGAEDYVMVSADISPGRYSGPINETWHLPLPDINEVSQRFAELASNVGRQLANLVEENVTRDIRRALLEQISGTSTDGDPNMLVTEHERMGLASASTSSEEAHMRLLESAYLLSNVSVERAAALFSSTSAAMMEMGQQFLSVPPTVWNGSCILGRELAWRFSFKCLTFIHVVVTRNHAHLKRKRDRFVTRIQTTLRGSADDIGWLVNSSEYPPAEDGTEDFLRALEQIGRGVHTLPDTLTYLLVPGLFSNHGPLYFFDTKNHFAKLGLPCHIAKIHSESGVEKNAREIKDHIEELYKSTGRQVVLLGHSKGGVDAAAACSMFWPQLKDKVVGVILVQSPYGGSPIASDILREGQIADAETRRLMEILICRIFKGDILSLEDLTYDKRKEFLAKYPLPADVPLICFHTEASRTPRAVSVMSHIAHAQLPWLPGMARGSGTEKEEGGGTKLPVAVPLAAAMAICALHLELRYKEKSDGLVTRKDSEVPGSIVVKPEKKLDHAWMVYAPSRHEPNEPDAAQMCEALIAVLLHHHHHRWRRPLPGPPIFSNPNEFLTTDAARSFLADSEEEQPCSTSLGKIQVGTSSSTSSNNRVDNQVPDTSSSSSVIEGVESMRQIADMIVLDAIARAIPDGMAPARVLQSDQSTTVVDDATKGSTQP